MALARTDERGSTFDEIIATKRKGEPARKIYLPVEVVQLVTMAAVSTFSSTKLERLATFKSLRLVSSLVKTAAETAWNAGLAAIAGGAAVKLLAPGHPHLVFAIRLYEARGILSSIKSLFIGCYEHPDLRLYPRLELEPIWFFRLCSILAVSATLESLTIDIYNEYLALKLLYAPFWLRELHLLNVRKAELSGLDLYSATMLEVLEVDGSIHRVLGVLERVKLPSWLKTLKLTGLALNSPEVNRLGLAQLPYLEHLDLSGSSLSWPLPPMPPLKELVLANSGLGTAFLSHVALWTTLEQVSLRNNSLIDSAFPLRLGLNTSIRELDLSFTSVFNPAALELTANTSLRTLKLDACPFASFAFGLASNTSLTKLSLAHCPTTPSLMKELARELAINTTLAELDMQGCGLTDDKLSAFKLERTSGLKELVLRNNPFTEGGIKMLADSITEHGLLQKLDISSCANVSLAFALGLMTSERVFQSV